MHIILFEKSGRFDSRNLARSNPTRNGKKSTAEVSRVE